MYGWSFLTQTCMCYLYNQSCESPEALAHVRLEQ